MPFVTFDMPGDMGGSSLPPADPKSLILRDNVFRLRGRPNRQKCSVFSIEFSDQGCVTGRFEPVVLALEIGKKLGLDRIATPA